jgi:surface carbohydrate biosynthesis protein
LHRDRPAASVAGARRILLVVPRPLRDLEGYVLLARHLEEFGHEVLLHTGPGAGERMLELAPDAIVLDYLGWDRAEEARLARLLGIRVVVLPTAGTYEQPVDHARAAGKESGTSELVDCFLAWGEASRRAILELTGIDPARVHVSGCPRFDLYSEPYLALLGKREAFWRRLGLPDPSAPTILWATNTNHFARDWIRLIRDLVLQENRLESEVREGLEDEKTQFTEHSRVLRVLAERHPSWNFVIKVHPLEAVEPYRVLTEGHPNVRVAFDAPIREFLYHSDVLLQRGCTTATEAWMLGKPVLELDIGRFQTHWVAPDYLLGSHVVRDIDEADRTIQQYLGGMPIPEEKRLARDAYLEAAYYRIDGRSSERSAALIDNVVSPPSRTNVDRKRTHELACEALRAHRHRQDRRLANRVKDFLRIRRSRSVRFWRNLGRHPGESGAVRGNGCYLMTTDRIEELRRRYAELFENRSDASSGDGSRVFLDERSDAKRGE